jgi:hypothetical protein
MILKILENGTVVPKTRMIFTNKRFETQILSFICCFYFLYKKS